MVLFHVERGSLLYFPFGTIQPRQERLVIHAQSFKRLLPGPAPTVFVHNHGSLVLSQNGTDQPVNAMAERIIVSAWLAGGFDASRVDAVVADIRVLSSSTAGRTGGAVYLTTAFAHLAFYRATGFVGGEVAGHLPLPVALWARVDKSQGGPNAMPRNTALTAAVRAGG